ncbi:MAG: hypothetical protein ABIN97_18390 [Ginsengibacter sp.]
METIADPMSASNSVSTPVSVVASELNYGRLKRIVIDGESIAIFFVLLAWQLLLPNGIYLFTGFTVIYILLYNIQQPLKPGIFTLILLMHFLQIIAGVWLTNYVEKDINFNAAKLSDATMGSLIGLLFMFLPIYYYQNKLPYLKLNDLKRDAFKLNTGKAFNCYLVALIVTSSLSAVAFAFSGITQIIFSFIKVKWLFFLLFGYLSILKKEKRNLFYLFVVIEFASGFYSFFSEFKTVIFYLIVLLVSLIRVINVKQLIIGGAILSCLVLFALVWTGIKTEYRSFLNKGSRQQVAAASKEDALNKLYSLSNNVSEESLNSSVYQFLDRLQYTYHFALTIARVPAIIPHTNGKNWINNIGYVTTPRFLNPDKPAFDATEKAKKYTGRRLSGRKSGASFSLGYFAECYIDFGLWGMMFPLFLIGLMYGSTYWYLMRNSSANFIFNYSVVGAFFMEFSAFEMDGTYLLGRFLATLITFVVLIRLFFPWVMNYVSEPQLKKS